MRHFEVVDHSFVGVLAMGGKDVAAGEEALGDGEATVGEEDDDEAETADILAVIRQSLNITHYQEENYQAHGDASDVAREAACLDAKIEEAENEDGNQHGDDELNLNESVFKNINIGECANDDKRIGSQHAVDAVHEVVDIEDSREDNDQQDYLPQLKCIDICPETDQHRK